MISPSTNSSRRGRLSMSVTGTPMRGENRRVLSADDPAAHDDDGVRDSFEPEQAIRIDHGLVVKRHLRGSGRFGAHGNDDKICGVFDRAGCLPNPQSVRIDKGGRAVNHIDTIAGHLIPDDGDFVGDDVVGAESEVFDRDRLL